MTKIEILDTGILDRNDSAFPTVVRLDSGDLIAAFTVGGGPNVTGGTHWARSRDGGKTWSHEGAILSRGDDPPTSNGLRLSRTRDGTLLAYGVRTYRDETGKKKFGATRNEPVLCRSTDGARTWSSPEVLPNPFACSLEISNPVVVLSSGCWLAPAATLPHPDRLGERVVVMASSDQGKTWPRTGVVFEDHNHVKGFFEQKLIELEPGRVLAMAWTVRMGDYTDFENHFVLSEDDGRHWGPAHSTGIHGQTMTGTWLGGRRLLVLYNRRHGQQGIRMCLVRFTDSDWTVEFEDTLWDAASFKERSAHVVSGIEEFDSFAFGLPSAIPLKGDVFLAVHWCKEGGVFGIRWTLLRISL